ncbi:MAG: RES family NAD+ phosphorylase [Mariniphaga sp.]
MIVYRITGKKHADDLSGTGAAIYGGRWNKKGTPVLYTGENREIALLEALVHIPAMLVPDLAILTLEIPDHSISEIELMDLPKNWTSYPAPTILSEIAEDWVKLGMTIALKVPSCIINNSHIFIINCGHRDYNMVKLLDRRDFHFDTRLRK